jgi:hypothetical protein
MFSLSPNYVDKSVSNSDVHCIFAYKNAFFTFVPKKQARQTNILFSNKIFVAER